MKAIIIAGGRGERLLPLTNTIPKPMVLVEGKPILLHALNLLKSHGIKDFIIAVCYLPEVITSYFGDGSQFGVTIRYTYEDPQKPLGTSGAIMLSKDLITESFIVTYADILRKLDVTKMIKAHKKTKAFATLHVYKRIGLNAKSMVEFDTNKKILRFEERPSGKNTKHKFIWVNGSFYILEPDIFDFIPDYKKSDFGKDTFPELLSHSKAIHAYPTTDYFIDIGNLKKLKQARKDIKNKLV